MRMRGDLFVFQSFFIAFVIIKNQPIAATITCPKPDEGNSSTLLRFLSDDPYFSKDTICGCVSHQVEMRCCAVGYSQLLWYEWSDDHKKWVDFMLYWWFQRDLIDENQTAILERASIDRSFKCVAYGETPSDHIEHTINVTIKSCLPKMPPLPFQPPSNATRFEFQPGENVTLLCGADFDPNVDSCNHRRFCNDSEASEVGRPQNCFIGWERIVGSSHNRTSIPEGNSTSGLRVYSQTIRPSTSEIDNRMISELFIFSAEVADAGDYVCQMINPTAMSQIYLALVKSSDGPFVMDRRVRYVVIVLGCLAVVITVLVSMVYRRRWDIIIRWRELRSTDKDGRTNDILLLSADSTTVTQDATFASYLQKKLEILYGYKVITENEINGGKDTISEWVAEAANSRCVLVILSPDSLKDLTTLTPLRDIIRTNSDIVFFVLFQVEYDNGNGCFVNQAVVTDLENQPNVTDLENQPSVTDVENQALVTDVENDRDVVVMALNIGPEFEAAIRIKIKIGWPQSATSTVFDEKLAWEEIDEIYGEDGKRFWKDLDRCLPVANHRRPQPTTDEETPLASVTF